MAPPALNELTALLGRRVRMCPLTTQVDGEERAAQDERTRDQLPVTKPDGAEYYVTTCRSAVGAGRR
jgi:hypothetical protein